MKNEQVICATEPVASFESKNEENDTIKCEEAKDFNEKLNYEPNPKKWGGRLKKFCFHGCTSTINGFDLQWSTVIKQPKHPKVDRCAQIKNYHVRKKM